MISTDIRKQQAVLLHSIPAWRQAAWPVFSGMASVFPPYQQGCTAMKREPPGASYDTTRIGGQPCPARSRCTPGRPEQQREYVTLRRALLGLAGW